MTHKVSTTIIGGGAVGLAVAYQLLAQGHDDIVLLEKNDAFGREQSDRSSGVMHSGIFQKPGSLMARLCADGQRMLYKFCNDYDVPHHRCGKLVIAQDPDEEAGLEDYVRRAKNNGVKNVRQISSSDVKRIEPDIEAISALYCPDTGIIDAAAYVAKLRDLVMAAHPDPGLVMKGCKADVIEPIGQCFRIHVSQPRSSEKSWHIDSEIVINSAGLGSVDIYNMLHPDDPKTKQYLKGEFYAVNRQEGLDVSSCVYPIPRLININGNHEFEDYGTHLTPRVCSLPNRSYGLAKEVLVGPKFYETTMDDDFSHQLSSSSFISDIRKYLPGIRQEQLYKGHAGILGLVHGNPDFDIFSDSKYPGIIHLLGMESPALTSSLGIGRHVAGIVRDIR